jgi:hypothetical protein
MIALSRMARLVVAAVATVLVLGLIARASAAPLKFHDGTAARLRLSWSARPERIEVCRTLSPAELAQREEHMRQRVECDGRFATYGLRVESDGQRLGETVVHGAGLRHDRPLYLLREYDVAPGVHRVRVSFTRREKTDNDAAAFAKSSSTEADTGIFAGRAQREAVEHARRASAAIPAHLELDTTLTFATRQVMIVTFAAEGRGLVLLTDGSASRRP